MKDEIKRHKLSDPTPIPRGSRYRKYEIHEGKIYSRFYDWKLNDWGPKNLIEKQTYEERTENKKSKGFR